MQCIPIEKSNDSDLCNEIRTRNAKRSKKYIPGRSEQKQRGVSSGKDLCKIKWNEERIMNDFFSLFVALSRALC